MAEVEAVHAKVTQLGDDLQSRLGPRYKVVVIPSHYSEATYVHVWRKGGRAGPARKKIVVFRGHRRKPYRKDVNSKYDYYVDLTQFPTLEGAIQTFWDRTFYRVKKDLEKEAE